MGRAPNAAEQVALSHNVVVEITGDPFTADVFVEFTHPIHRHRLDEWQMTLPQAIDLGADIVAKIDTATGENVKIIFDDPRDTVNIKTWNLPIAEARKFLQMMAGAIKVMQAHMEGIK